MMAPGISRRLPVSMEAVQLQLEALERLPCGCVVAIQSVRPSSVSVMSVEAKGPYCTFLHHRLNKVIRLGEPVEPPDYEEDEEVEEVVRFV